MVGFLVRRRGIQFCCALTVLLSGCGHHGVTLPSQSVSTLREDKGGGYAEVSNVRHSSIRIVREYVPVPVPGQLMPIPLEMTGPKQMGAEQNLNTPVFLSKEAAVKYANQHALQTPQSEDFFNAMMTYSFMPEALYTIYAAPMKITDVALQAGEKVISIAAGDSLRWQISQTYSGQGATVQQHLLIKPNSAGLENTLVVTTSLRVYHLVMMASKDGTYMVSVSWTYPDAMVQFEDKRDDAGASGAQPKDSDPGAFQLDLANLDFNYQFGLVAGPKPRWYPERIFNNRRQTFIQFPMQISSDNAPLPMLFVAERDNNYGTMYNWRQRGRYMIIDSVINKAKLQTGVAGKDQTVVQIEYKSTN